MREAQADSEQVANATLAHLRSTLFLSVSAKLLNVVFSVLSTRYLGVANFGEMFVSQSLLLSLSLFLLKEAFRREAQRTALCEELAWVSVYVSVACGSILCVFWVLVLKLRTLTAALMLCAIAVEALAEPHIYRRLRDLDFGCKTKAELYANLARSVVLAGLAMQQSQYIAVHALACAQLVYAVVWFFLLKQENVQVFTKPGKWIMKQVMPRQTIVLAVQKLVLTEAEKFVLLAFFSQVDWSVFALVSNFGSLVLRTVFAPIEDVAFSGFARGDKQAVGKIFGLQTSLGLGVAMFGPPIADWAVLILYGQSWLQQPGVVTLLRLYCLYIFFCSVNGITEAFFYAKADAEPLARATKAQPVIAAIQLLSAILFRRLGPVALVLANIVGMCLRVRLCWRPELNQVFVTSRVRSGLSLVLGGFVAWTLPALLKATAVQRLAAVVAVGLASATPLAKQTLADFKQKI